MPKMPTTVLHDLPARLQTAARDVRDTTTARLHALELRDHLVVQACDAGMTEQEVARLIGVHKSRVSAILRASDPEDD